MQGHKAGLELKNRTHQSPVMLMTYWVKTKELLLGDGMETGLEVDEVKTVYILSPSYKKKSLYKGM